MGRLSKESVVVKQRSQKDMSETAKIKKLLSAWIDYIYLEDLSNASVDAVTPKGQNIWFKGVSLIGDNLLLSKSLFTELKEQYFSKNALSNQPEIKIAVAFPQIYLVQKKTKTVSSPLYH
jgi:hypothetical protein